MNFKIPLSFDESKKINQRFSVIYLLSLCLILVSHFINNFIWLKISRISYSGHDVFNHLLDRNTFYWQLVDILANKTYIWHKKLLLLAMQFNTNSNWPRLVYFISSVTSLLFGNTIFVIFISTIVYFFILIISVYFIGKECMDKKAGILAAFLISFYPGIFGMSRSFGLDFPLTAMTALTILLLLKTDNFKDRKYAILFGFILGLGVLTKGQIIFFIAGPFCYILYKIILRENKSHFRCFANIIISFIIAAIISSLWWRGNIKAIFLNGFLPRFIPFADMHTACKEIFTFRWLFFYFFGTIVNISPLFFILFIVVFSSFLKSKIKYKKVILFWIIIPYVIFTIIYTKNFRFYLPSFPAIALASAFGITNAAYDKKKLFILFVAVWGLWQFFALSYIQLGFLHSLIKERKIVNFYDDRDKLYYPIRHKDNFLNIINALGIKIQEETSAIGKKVIRISGVRFGDEALPKYIVKIIAIFGIGNKLCSVIHQPQGYKDFFNFLIIGLKDKNIDEAILELQKYRPSVTYRIIDGPYYYPTNNNKEISEFFFLLKAEETNAKNHKN